MIRFLCALTVIVALGFANASRAASVDDFYKGKNVRIVVGFSAGGGFDTYARALARHMGKHIPGSPELVVENMTGAGSLIAANHVYKVAKPDGLTIGHFIGGLFLGQVLGQPGIEFDARKFEFIGAPISDHVVCAMTKASGITSVDEWMASKTPVKMGGLAPGTSTPDNATRILKAALGLPIQLVTGYKGTADVRLAAEGGELAGGCWGWDSISVTWRKALDSGDAVVVLQANRKNSSRPAQCPAGDQARQERRSPQDDRRWHPRRQRYRAAPTPCRPARPKIACRFCAKHLRQRSKMRSSSPMRKKSRLNIDPIPAEEIEKDIAGLFKLDPALVSKLKDVLYN